MSSAYASFDYIIDVFLAQYIAFFIATKPLARRGRLSGGGVEGEADAGFLAVEGHGFV